MSIVEIIVTLFYFNPVLFFRHPQLLKELEEEHFQRKSYASYLVRSRQGLIATREFLEKMLGRVERFVETKENIYTRKKRNL